MHEPIVSATTANGLVLALHIVVLLVVSAALAIGSSVASRRRNLTQHRAMSVDAFHRLLGTDAYYRLLAASAADDKRFDYQQAPQTMNPHAVYFAERASDMKRFF